MDIDDIEKGVVPDTSDNFNGFSVESHGLPEVAEFAAALSDGPYEFKLWSQSTVCVFHKDQPLLSVGTISYRDMRSRGEGVKRTYNVTAPGIRNSRFRDRQRVHTTSSASLDSALRTARRYLVPVDTKAFASCCFPAIRNALSELQTEARRARDVAWRKVTNVYYSSGPMENLLLHLADRPDVHSFPNADDIVAFKAAHDAYNEPELLMNDLRFVQKRGANYFVLDAVYDRDDYNNLKYQGDPSVYTQDNLPPFIQDRLAVLQIMEPGAGVAGVGVRLDDNIAVVCV
jgi:hypothetical protein